MYYDQDKFEVSPNINRTQKNDKNKGTNIINGNQANALLIVLRVLIQ